MRRLPSILVLCAWLLASGAQWDLLQGFAWVRMIATYSRTMPLDEAVRLTFTPNNLCGVCAFVADAKTRVSADSAPSGAADSVPASADTLAKAKAKAPIAPAPEHLFVFQVLPAPVWPRENFAADECSRPAPPVEPPRAA